MTRPAPILERRPPRAAPMAAPEADADVELGSRPAGLTRWLVLTAAIVAVVAVVAAGLVGLWYTGKVNPTGDPGAPVTFTVNKGDTLVDVADRLTEQGLVSDSGLFQYYVGHHGGVVLTPGYYRIRPSDHMGNVMRILNTPPSQTYNKITFPEGFTVAKMAKKLGETMPRLSAAAFETVATDGTVRSTYSPPGQNSLEGLLFPDTYQVSNDATETEAAVARRMVALMERVARQEGIDKSQERFGLEPYQVLIVASMIEREAKTAADRPLIARVIYNRLFLGMPLQIDATLYYGQNPDTPFTDLKAIDTPYNTYLHEGLPPTPIANPGRASIKAALNPAQNPAPNDPKLCNNLPNGQHCLYLYYVLKDDLGNHEFSVTLEQHEAAIERARQAGLL